MSKFWTKEDVKELVKQEDFKSPKEIQEKLKELFSDVLQEVLEAELDQELGYDKNTKKPEGQGNARNGYSKKTVRSEYGNIDLEIPRDRKSEFEPQLVQKHSRDVSGIEDIVIAMYGRGLSTRDIHDQINEMYSVEISAEMVSKITDRILPRIKEWQNRPLETVYTFVFMDAIHYKVRENNQIKSKAAYVVLGVDIGGCKDVLGIWIGETESSKFWLSVLNDLKNRGVTDVVIFSVDGLSGFQEAIQAVYPESEIQRCIIHQLRNSFKYVAFNDRKELAKDFKSVYTAPNEKEAYDNLMILKDKWTKYPNAFRSWEKNWDVLSPFLKFPAETRKIMYTTNIIENLHRQYRKVTKAKSVFPTDFALQKMLYLATINVTKKWSMRYRNWDKILNQLLIFYPRLDKYL